MEQHKDRGGNLCLCCLRQPCRWRPGASSDQSPAPLWSLATRRLHPRYPCACHISIGGKQRRRSTRCVGCVRGANFFGNTHRHARARWLSPGFFFFSFPLPQRPPTFPVPYYATARRGGLQGDQTICSSTTSSSPFSSGRSTSSRAASTVLPATVLSRRCLAARPGFKIKRREGRKKTSLWWRSLEDTAPSLFLSGVADLSRFPVVAFAIASACRGQFASPSRRCNLTSLLITFETNVINRANWSLRPLRL